MLTAVAIPTSMAFKWAMLGAHLKYLLELMTLNVKGIMIHLQWSTMFHVAKPWLMWRPLG